MTTNQNEKPQAKGPKKNPDAPMDALTPDNVPETSDQKIDRLEKQNADLQKQLADIVKRLNEKNKPITPEHAQAAVGSARARVSWAPDMRGYIDHTRDAMRYRTMVQGTNRYTDTGLNFPLNEAGEAMAIQHHQRMADIRRYQWLRSNGSVAKGLEETMQRARTAMGPSAFLYANTPMDPMRSTGVTWSDVALAGKIQGSINRGGVPWSNASGNYFYLDNPIARTRRDPVTGQMRDYSRNYDQWVQNTENPFGSGLRPFMPDAFGTGNPMERYGSKQRRKAVQPALRPGAWANNFQMGNEPDSEEQTEIKNRYLPELSSKVAKEWGRICVELKYDGLETFKQLENIMKRPDIMSDYNGMTRFLQLLPFLEKELRAPDKDPKKLSKLFEKHMPNKIDPERVNWGKSEDVADGRVYQFEYNKQTWGAVVGITKDGTRHMQSDFMPYGVMAGMINGKKGKLFDPRVLEASGFGDGEIKAWSDLQRQDLTQGSVLMKPANRDLLEKFRFATKIIQILDQENVALSTKETEITNHVNNTKFCKAEAKKQVLSALLSDTFGTDSISAFINNPAKYPLKLVAK